MKYKITTEANSRGTVHTLTDETGKVIATRTSENRTYAACYLSIRENGAVAVEGWSATKALAEKAAATYWNRVLKYRAARLAAKDPVPLHPDYSPLARVEIATV